MALAIILTILVARDRINKVAANNLISQSRNHINIFLRYNDIKDTRLCNALSEDLLYFALFHGTEQYICKTQDFDNIKSQEILRKFDDLKGEDKKILFNKRLNNDFLYYHSNISFAEKKYSVYMIFSAEKIFQFLVKTNNSILVYIFPIFIISTLLSLFGAMKMANPLRSILSKIISFSNIYTKENLISEIENSTQSEWEIIERSIDESEYTNRKLLSNLKKESNKFYTLLESLSDSILAIDSRGKVLFANNAFISSFSNRTTKIDNLNFIDVIRNHDLMRFIETSLKSDTYSFGAEFAIEVSESKKKYFYINTNPLKDTSGNSYGIVCIFHDLTSLKMAEKMRSDFVANVSHEIRTPLTAIKGYVQTIESIKPDYTESEKDILQTIVHNCDRLTSLFNDLLSLSTIEAINEVELSETNLTEITEQSISDTLQSFRDQQVNIHTEILVNEFISNPKMVEQIIINLVSNAIKYNESSEDIKIDLKWSEDEHHVHLQITDNGPGIAKEHLPRIFERFYRVDQSRNRNYGGTGLGLAIVKHLVQKLGGKISVSSELNIGTIFKIQFRKNLS